MFSFNSELKLAPIKHWDSDIIRIPHGFEDDVLLLENNELLQLDINDNSSNLKVFDFHPIHIFLNSFSLESYKNCKNSFSDYTELKKYKNIERTGVRNIFEKLIHN